MSEKYFATSDTLKDVLDEFGVAIIPKILTLEECDYYEEEMWKCLSHLTDGRINPEDQSTWRNFDDLSPKHNMLLQQYIGHAQYIWDNRRDSFAYKLNINFN